MESQSFRFRVVLVALSAMVCAVFTGGSALGTSRDAAPETARPAAGRADEIVKIPMTISKLKGTARFSVAARDAYQIKGEVPELAAAFDPLNKAVTIDMGGAVVDFTLDEKGRGKNDRGTFRLKLKKVRNTLTGKKEFVGGVAPFSINLKKGSWTDAWADEGVNRLVSDKDKPVTFVSDLTIESTVFTTSTLTNYSSKAEKSGKFKSN